MTARGQCKECEKERGQSITRPCSLRTPVTLVARGLTFFFFLFFLVDFGKVAEQRRRLSNSTPLLLSYFTTLHLLRASTVLNLSLLHPVKRITKCSLTRTSCVPVFDRQRRFCFLLKTIVSLGLAKREIFGLPVCLSLD